MQVSVLNYVLMPMQSANVDQDTWDMTQSRVRRLGRDASVAARAAKFLLTETGKHPGMQQFSAPRILHVCSTNFMEGIFSLTLIDVQSLPVHPCMHTGCRSSTKESCTANCISFSGPMQRTYSVVPSMRLAKQLLGSLSPIWCRCRRCSPQNVVAHVCEPSSATYDGSMEFQRKKQCTS